MARYGLPDYGMYAALENMGNLVDYGELAARLGSIVTFNREGNIVFIDNFEKTPLKWSVEKEIGTETAGFSTENVLSGGQSLKLATVANASSKVAIKRYFPIFCTKKQGIEIAIKGSVFHSNIFLSYFLSYKHISNHFLITIDTSNNILQYYDEGGFLVTFEDSLELKQANYLFHRFKMVVNLETGCYIRFIMDRTEYPLNDISCRQAANIDDDYFYAHILLQNTQAYPIPIYLDNFILTQNEP